MPGVLVTEKDLHPAAVAVLSDAGFDPVYMSGEITEERLIRELRETAPFALLQRGNPPVTRRVLEAGQPELRMISRHGVGINTLDLAAATELGLPVATAGDAGAPSVAEHVMALILSAWRDVLWLDSRLKLGRWDHTSYLGRELRGHTLGLVGFGRIAARVAALAQAFGMRVIATSRTPARIDPDLAADVGSLDALLDQSDIVSLHVPLNAQTAGIIGDAELGRMKKTALLVNVGRGGLVDEEALARRLHAGDLAGAAVDVLMNEPPQPGDPLLAAPNVIATPHIAAFTAGSMERTATTAARNIVRFHETGTVEPALLANPEVMAGSRNADRRGAGGA
ncbi:MAG: NAD(P)-dependent oxidoreductase [Roseovarius sp.]